MSDYDMNTVRSLPYVYYAHGTYAYWDEEMDAYYNDFGQELRNPSEYDTSTEGYTPFGDEGYDYY